MLTSRATDTAWFNECRIMAPLVIGDIKCHHEQKSERAILLTSLYQRFCPWDFISMIGMLAKQISLLFLNCVQATLAVY